MGLQLYMVGVMVEDMEKAVEFYRRLGVAIPEGAETRQHVPIEMNGITFFLNTKTLNARWDPARTDGSGGYRIILEFYLESAEVLDAKYNEMMDYGYESHVPPYVTPFNMYFGMINDPDGNTILLSSNVPSDTA